MGSIGATSTDVANIALTLIGAEPIMDIESPVNKQGRVCKAMFEFAKRSAFTEHPWACLLRRAIIATNAVSPKFGYEYAYTIPSDCLRLYRILDASRTEDVPVTDRFKVEGNAILCNIAAPLHIQYIADTSNFSVLTPHVYDVLVHTLAERIVLTITGKSTIYREMSRKLKEVTEAAVFTDSTVDTPPDVQGLDTFGDAHYGYQA